MLVVDHFLVQFVLLPRNADLPVLTEDTLEDSDTSEIRHASPPPNFIFFLYLGCFILEVVSE